MIKVFKRSKNQAGPDFDSLVVEIPPDFAVSHGLPERAFASLTVQNGKLVSDILPYTDQDQSEVKTFLAEFPDLDEEMKRVGD